MDILPYTSVSAWMLFDARLLENLGLLLGMARIPPTTQAARGRMLRDADEERRSTTMSWLHLRSLSALSGEVYFLNWKSS